MKQITLSDENYGTLMRVVEFAVDDLSTTEGKIGSKSLEDVINLQSAIEFCTKDVAE